MLYEYRVTLLHSQKRKRNSDMAERNLENITITMTKEEKRALKQAALDNDVSVSELVRRWIAEYWGKEEKKE